MSDILNVSTRTVSGRRDSKRLRKQGLVPAVLYGHNQANVNLSIPASELHHALRHGAHLVEVKGAANESALIRDVQWDVYGHAVLHVDLVRVSKSEAVEVAVKVELRGTAPGTREGGIVEHLLHELRMMCPAAAIPDSFAVSINDLHLGGTITAGQVKLPEGAKLLVEEDQAVVVCVVARPVEEEISVGETIAEPEVIGRKASAEEEGGE
jgi:large subunit ribosomal protein L25